MAIEEAAGTGGMTKLLCGKSEEKRHPRYYLYRAVKKLQEANLQALQRGEGRGNSTVEMVAVLDRECHFSELFEALEHAVEDLDCWYVSQLESPAGAHDTCLTIQQARNALAKARGELA